MTSDALHAFQYNVKAFLRYRTVRRVDQYNKIEFFGSDVAVAADALNSADRPAENEERQGEDEEGQHDGQ